MGNFTTSVRLFSGRLDPPAFVDQRLIQLNPLDDVDIGLSHALLNSSIGMFIIEALGFGRALGVLDLNRTVLKNSCIYWTPVLWTRSSLNKSSLHSPRFWRGNYLISPMKSRTDRQYFDDAIIEAFDLKVPREAVYESLRELVSIRMSVKN